jgi:hypothetical protein
LKNQSDGDLSLRAYNWRATIGGRIGLKLRHKIPRREFAWEV